MYITHTHTYIYTQRYIHTDTYEKENMKIIFLSRELKGETKPSNGGTRKGTIITVSRVGWVSLSSCYSI